MPSPFTLPRTELHDLPLSPNGRRYQLQVALPFTYASMPDRRYPVIFLTDGYWDLPLAYAIYGNMLFDKVLPECILVGIGYPGEELDYEALRGWDLTPAPEPRRDPPSPGGGAPDYLRMIEDQALPFVDRTFRTRPDMRVLAGSSLGGLFALYTLFSRPSLFQAYVAVSPAAVWASDWIFGLEERFFTSGDRALQARLFMSGAAEEWPEFLAAIQRFDARIQSRAYAGLDYQWRLIDGETHASTKAEGLTRGLRFAFGGYRSSRAQRA